MFFIFCSLHQLTPLHRAARRGRKLTVEYFVELQAGVDDKDDKQVNQGVSLSDISMHVLTANQSSVCCHLCCWL